MGRDKEERGEGGVPSVSILLHAIENRGEKKKGTESPFLCSKRKESRGGERNKGKMGRFSWGSLFYYFEGLAHPPMGRGERGEREG